LLSFLDVGFEGGRSESKIVNAVICSGFQLSAVRQDGQVRGNGPVKSEWRTRAGDGKIKRKNV
jgi:hypothetical protein